MAGRPPGRADAAELEAELRRAGSPARAASEKAYLKSDLEFAGVPVPVMRAVVAAWSKGCSAPYGSAPYGSAPYGSAPNGSASNGSGLDRERLTAVARALWDSPLYESRQAAVILLERNSRLLALPDAELIEHLLRNSHTWALVDGLAVNVAGELAERHEAMVAALDRWAVDADFWIRRSALLALLRPLRRGEGDFERFGRYADAMLEEREFFVRKAIGWVLRETAKRRPALVAGWLAPRVHRASGVTVREAVKPLSPAHKELLLAGYRGKRPVQLDVDGDKITRHLT